MKTIFKQKNSYEKPRIARAVQDEGCKKITLFIPGKNIREIAVFSHEKLSKIREWAIANNYKLDETGVQKPVKKVFVPSFDDEYTY